MLSHTHTAKPHAAHELLQDSQHPHGRLARTAGPHQQTCRPLSSVLLRLPHTATHQTQGVCVLCILKHRAPAKIPHSCCKCKNDVEIVAAFYGISVSCHVVLQEEAWCSRVPAEQPRGEHHTGHLPQQRRSGGCDSDEKSLKKYLMWIISKYLELD